MEQEKKGSEKRTKVRIPFIYGIEFEQAPDSTLSSRDFFKDEQTNVIIKDVSQDGIQIVTPKFIPEGTMVKLILRFPRPRTISRNTADTLDCAVQAQVRWIDKNKTGKGFRAGVNFVRYEGNAQEVINKYLDDNIVIEEEELK
jgi:hypothetical protein